MASTRVTIQDVADKLGLSKFSVSRALSGKPGVGEATRSRVLRAAHAMGYRVNADIAHSIGQILFVRQEIDMVSSDVDAFIAQLSPDLETLRRFTYLGGSSYDSPVATGVDAAGRIHVVLSSTSSMLPLRGDGAPYAGTGTGADIDRDFYWAALSPELATLDFATYFGSSGDDVCWSAAVRGMALP